MLVIKKLKAAWQWTGGKKAYGNKEYQKAAELFAQSAEAFPDWSMTHFWQLRTAIQTGDLEQAQQRLVKCREIMPQLEDVLNRWETLLKDLLHDNNPTSDELAELDTYTDEQLQNKWQKPQWSWKSVSIVTILPFVTEHLATFITALFRLPSYLITENIFIMFTLWWWWNYHRKRVPNSQPFMVWFLTGVRICEDICKHYRLFHVLFAVSLIDSLLYLFIWTDPSNYVPGKKFFGWYGIEGAVFPIWYVIRFVLGYPLVEEMIFRDTLFSFFRDKWKREYTYVLLSAVFALIHIEHVMAGNLNAIIRLFILSIISTWFYEKYRHLFAAVLIHGLNNGLAVLNEMVLWYLIYSKVQ